MDLPGMRDSTYQKVKEARISQVLCWAETSRDHDLELHHVSISVDSRCGAQMTAATLKAPGIRGCSDYASCKFGFL